MGIINVLDQKTISLISAGEVVERPASVIKELMENAIDAGSKNITVEIRAGGANYMRVTDDGKGMSREDVLLCIKKHATSKIKNSDDLDSIFTLGFRGEALSAISSVSRFEIISKQHDDVVGTKIQLSGDSQISVDEVGCPHGTTVTVCDLFFNIPARRKFLKKPATETGVISQYVEKIALSHPDISFKYIVDGSVKIQTPGDSSLTNTIYAVYGKEFSSGLAEVSYQQDDIKISGYITKPEFLKNNRNYQSCFVNNRYVRAKSLMFGIDDAYKNYILSDKHPCYVIFCQINPSSIDVNVHPSKLEIKFSDERAVYSAAYTAVKTTLMNLKNPISQPEIPVVQQVSDIEKTETKPNEPVPRCNTAPPASTDKKSDFGFKEFSQIFKIEQYQQSEKVFVPRQDDTFKQATPTGVLRTVCQPEESKGDAVVPDVYAQDREISSAIQKAQDNQTQKMEQVPDYRVVGEIFNTYILVENEQGLVLVDKHAAHERILYQDLKISAKNNSIQMLMVPVVVELDRKTSEHAEDFIPQITQAGFEMSGFGDNTFVVRSVPGLLSGISSGEITDIVTAMALNVAEGKKASTPIEDIFDQILHTAACKAAIKANRHYADKDMEFLIKRLYEIGNIAYCPHGRPVSKIFTKKELDKLFFRT